MNINDFSGKLKEILTDYSDEVKRKAENILPIVAKEVVAELKETSPKDTGKYAKGWRATIETGRLGNTLVIHNRSYYLTHLLENGYVHRNGKRVEGKKHILPASEFAEEEYVKLLQRELTK